MQDEHGLFSHGDDHTEQDRALTSAFVLFLLARLAGFREAARFALRARAREEKGT